MTCLCQKYPRTVTLTKCANQTCNPHTCSNNCDKCKPCNTSACKSCKQTKVTMNSLDPFCSSKKKVNYCCQPKSNALIYMLQDKRKNMCCQNIKVWRKVGNRVIVKTVNTCGSCKKYC